MSYLSNFHHQFAGNENSEKKLVFVHGLMGYGANWRPIAREFESEYHILYYDQRGHGRSISPKSGYAPEDFADDLKQILDEIGWSKVYLVGHSMGGRVVAEFTYQHPEMVKKLVIEDIGPDANPEAIRRIEELIDGVPSPFAGRKEAKEYFMNDFLKQFSDRPNAKALGMFPYSNFAEKSDGQVSWKIDPEVVRQCVHEGRKRDRYEEFAKISVPTLLIRGETSEELDSEVYQRVLAENQHIKGLEIAGAGHWVHYDQLSAFVEALKGHF